MMNKIAVICALEKEIAPFLARLENGQKSESSKYTVYEGTLCGHDAVLICCGVNKVNAALAAHIACDKYSASAVINAGVAGGIDTRLKIGDTAIGTEYVYHDTLGDSLTKHFPQMDVNCFFTGGALLEGAKNAVSAPGFSHPVYFGRIATGEGFIETDGRDELIKNHNPLCVDNESAAIAHACYLCDVPFMAVRSISDTAEHSGMDSYYDNYGHAAQSCFEVTCAILDALNA